MNDHGRIPDLYVERDALGELPLQLEPELGARIEKEPQRSARLAELHASNQEILKHYPPEQMATRIRQRLAQNRSQPRPKIAFWLSLSAVPIAVVLAATIWVLAPISDKLEKPEQTTAQDLESVRSKGIPRLVVHRHLTNRTELLEPGDEVRPGDLLQLSYRPEQATHGVIVSVDGRGQVTLHFPEDKNQTTSLENEELVSLPFSYELDDAPAFECFFLVTGNEPISVERVIEAAKKIGTDPRKGLDLPAGLRQKAFFLNKPVGR